MKRRLLIFCLLALLLASAAFAYYEVSRIQKPSLPPPAERVVPPSPMEQSGPAKQEIPAVTASEEEEEDEARAETVRARLKKADLVKEQKPLDANFSMKKQKAREIVPGVTLENKELTIQLEKENESLTIRRSKTSEDGQMQMLWKQKF